MTTGKSSRRSVVSWLCAGMFLANCGLNNPALINSNDGGTDSGLETNGTGEDATVGSGVDAAEGADAASVGSPIGPGDGGAALDATGDGPADARAIEACVPNACGTCSVLAAAPGTACGTCGKYACDSASGGVTCNDPGHNACGGCGTLAGAPNSSCGCNGKYMFVCSSDKTSVTCNDPGANACGGCGALTAAPGASCGSCGVYACSADKASVACNDPGLNACGGCGTLTEAPNAACGSCGSYVCNSAKTAVSCSDPGHNACGGCGTLSATLGAACGQCGTYVCNSSNSAVTCNDPGTTNNCPTWCSSHPAPSGVASTDYACLDFDKSTSLPPSGWTQKLASSGSLTVSTARADSTPNSLYGTVTANSSDIATLIWSPAAGAASLKSISLSAAIDPTYVPQVVPSGSVGTSLLEIDCGGNFVRLEYTVNGTSGSGATGYTGLYVYWAIIGSAAIAGSCPVTTNLTINAWNTVELDLDMSNLGAITVTINGTTATSGCNASNGTDTVATLMVGPNESAGGNTFPWTGYFDDVQATVRR